MNLKSAKRIISYYVFRTRHFNDKCVKKFAKRVHNKKILELGSGKKIKGKYTYSAKKFFESSNEFICSDINNACGHRIIDVTKMNFNKEFDIILCLSILEHVFDFNKAIKNIHKALKPKGTVLIFVPGFYPLHEEPLDYWRFTEHSLKRMLKDFKQVEVKTFGLREYPIGYFIIAKK